MPEEKVFSTAEKNFIEACEWAGKAVSNTAKEKGWWVEDRNEAEILALIHSELSECLEALRVGNPPDSHCPEFSSAEVELADALVRIFDYAEYRGFKVGEAMIAKNDYNKTRPYRHGNKKF